MKPMLEKPKNEKDCTRMVVYLSGQISGVANRNRFAFQSAALKIKNQFAASGYCEIINPVLIGEKVDEIFKATSDELNINTTPDWQDYMRHCIRELTRASHIFMLEGWEKSKGAKVEKELAEKIGIKVCCSIDDLKKSYRNSVQTGKW